MKFIQLRQGDVQIKKVGKLSDGGTEADNEREHNRIVLAHGEDIFDQVNASVRDNLWKSVAEKIPSNHDVFFGS